MRITALEAIPVALPIHHAGPPTGFGGRIWQELTHVLVRVETDAGLTGWGEAFGYNIAPATVAALRDTLAPLVVGREATAIAALHEELSRLLHLFGRAGPVRYALSGLDIALWDLAGKRAGLPLADLLGGAGRTRLPVYWSLLRYDDPAAVGRAVEAARAAGLRAFKLHEVREAPVAAARAVLGPEAPLMLDVNCAWRFDEALAMARALAPYRLAWLEEPIWPPEDLASLARLARAVPDLPLAAGENVGSAAAFAALAAAEGLSILQPSVTKLGGITSFLAAAAASRSAGKLLVPHSPYFGPGLLATLQLAARFTDIPFVELFGVTLVPSLYGDLLTPDDEGGLRLPPGPGLGADPDPAVIAAHRSG
jgi:D-galactarolactone cycloisomerase